MLRTLFAPETYLNSLIQEKQWEEVKQRIKTHPFEAKPNHSVQRGISPSSLACAVRGGATLDVIAALVAACPELIAIKHYRSGNILHDATRYKCSVEIMQYLVDEIIRHEQNTQWMSRGELKPIQIQYEGSSPRSTIDINQGAPTRNRPYTHDTMFNQNDDLGRTPLHCLMYRATLGHRKALGERFTFIVSKIVAAFPPAVGKKDGDGFTPLDIILTTPKVWAPNLESEMELELRIFCLCSILIKAYPNAMWISSFNRVQSDIYKKIKIPFHTSMELSLNATPLECTSLSGNQSYAIAKKRQMLSNSLQGTIELNQVSHALLHDRHVSTIELLTEANKLSNASWYTGHIHEWNESKPDHSIPSSIKQCCTVIVTRDFEVNMHLAVTMRCSIDVLKHLIHIAPDSSLVSDRCGLTPLDWLWIRFITDLIHCDEQVSHGSEHNFQQPKVKMSSRRIIPNNFIPFVEKQILKILNTLRRTIDDRMRQKRLDNNYAREEEEENSFRMKMNELLPIAAGIFAKTQDRSGVIKGVQHVHEWKLLHGAAYMYVPRYVVLSAISVNPHDLMLQDSIGNLPLHYAAARSGYKKNLHLGITSETHELIEKSPIFDLLHLCPTATKILNQYGQLPLHIAIDNEKHDLMRASDLNVPKPVYNPIPETSVVLVLSRANPASLEHKDGLTGLYPFMQAATEDKYTKANLSTIYALLKECPSLVQSEI